MSDDQSRSFTKFMGKHLVVLSGIAERYENGKHVKTDAFNLSGWILRIHDQFHWVTAGHCLKRLDDGIKDGTLKIIESGFADYFGDTAKYGHSVPFHYEPGCGFYIDDDTQGLDFGVIPLNLLTVLNLIENGVKAVGRENWEKQHEMTFEHYKMLGVPSHLCQFSLSPGGTVSGGIQPVMIALERIDPNTIPNPLPEEWFVGRLYPEVTIEDIAGMSGGPIYGFRKTDDGNWVYHVVALQSRWRQKSRVIFGCPVPLFAESLHQTIQEIIDAASIDEDSDDTQMP